MPAAIIGIEQRKAMKFRTAVMLLATPILIAGFWTMSVICEKGKGKGKGKSLLDIRVRFCRVLCNSWDVKPAMLLRLAKGFLRS